MLELIAAPSKAAWDDEFMHLYCCDENLAWCGTDITDHRINLAEDEPECPLCVLAAYSNCTWRCNG